MVYPQGTETELIGQAGELCKLLEYKDDEAIASAALGVLQRMAGNKDCVADIAQAGVVPSLLMAIQTLPDQYVLGSLSLFLHFAALVLTGQCFLIFVRREVVLSILTAVAANPKIVLEIKDRGGLLYLLDLFANSSIPEVRVFLFYYFVWSGRGCGG